MTTLSTLKTQKLTSKLKWQVINEFIKVINLQKTSEQNILLQIYCLSHQPHYCPVTNVHVPSLLSSDATECSHSQYIAVYSVNISDSYPAVETQQDKNQKIQHIKVCIHMEIAF
jgi:hypothetical protein